MQYLCIFKNKRRGIQNEVELTSEYKLRSTSLFAWDGKASNQSQGCSFLPSSLPSRERLRE